MYKNLDCSIGLNNSDNLLIFKFRNSKFDNFVHNLENSNACRYLGGQILYKSLVPSKKNGVNSEIDEFITANILFSINDGRHGRCDLMDHVSCTGVVVFSSRKLGKSNRV